MMYRHFDRRDLTPFLGFFELFLERDHMLDSVHLYIADND
jgi:hypothetical protein